ncbi:hypothetical protein HMPREF1355_02202 [Enterococcus faecium 515]|nr:hypothetical protein HMPREF1355_02202 [Enterococcus faecium 515]
MDCQSFSYYEQSCESTIVGSFRWLFIFAKKTTSSLLETPFTGYL